VLFTRERVRAASEV